MNRIITLTTDYGSGDYFVGAMKGAILATFPDVTIVDITHGVTPHNVMEGALALRAAYAFFPHRTIHVAVVDPGVGGPRRGLLVASEKHIFIGPDNGLLSLAMAELESFTCIELTARHYFHPSVSPTFHGRDVFAPVAGWVAKGIEWRHFGQPIMDPVRLAFPKAVAAGGRIEGQVIHVDRFGNLVTSITQADLAKLPAGGGIVCRLDRVGSPSMPLWEFYAQAKPGEPCAVIGGSGFLEVAVNRGRADKLLEAGRGTKIIVSAAPAGDARTA